MRWNRNKAGLSPKRSRIETRSKHNIVQLLKGHAITSTEWIPRDKIPDLRRDKKIQRKSNRGIFSSQPSFFFRTFFLWGIFKVHADLDIEVRKK